MENTQTAENETNPAAEPTPAPATPAVEQPGQPAPQAQAQPETKTQTPQTETKTRGKQEFFKREEKREQKLSEQYAQRLAALEAELKAVREGKAQPQTQPEPEIDFLSDPEGWRKKVTEEAASKAAESYRTAAEKSAAEAAYIQKAEGAEKWLLTRSHLKQDPALETELVKILTQDEEIREIGRVSPGKAAELAYIQLCRSKGIMPDMDFVSGKDNQAAKGTTSAGVRPSAPSPGKRTFQKGEGHAYIMAAKPGTAEFDRRLAEVTEAEAEGRVKR